MSKNEHQEILSLFQCEYNRLMEEDFVQTLSENANVRVFFINENVAYTDGKNIIVDPSIANLYCDKEALRKTEDWISIPKDFSQDPWNALKIITRFQSIHESLHVIYSTIPSYAASDKRSTSKGRHKVLSLISNIIEDAYIESVGCSLYDNLEFFLVFGRISLLFSNTKLESTVENVMGNQSKNLISEYLETMVTFLLYPMAQQEEPKFEIKEYVEKTKQLFIDGSLCGDPIKRYRYTQKIFDLIEEIVPNEEEKIDESKLESKLWGMKSHSSQISSIKAHNHSGKVCNNLKRLFVNEDGSNRKFDFNKVLKEQTSNYQNEKNITILKFKDVGTKIEIDARALNSSPIHNHIKIIESKPKINMQFKKAYMNIYNKYKLNINTYNTKFSQLLKMNVPTKQEKLYFGKAISSNRLTDTRKRYWYKESTDIGQPDLGILLLIDGSGSMFKERRDSAMVSSIILHEVLKKQGIKHSIIEHRASFDDPTIDINILIDFEYRDEEKYNLMQIGADEGNRDGLALLWAEKYLDLKCDCNDKLILVLSDGVPAHGIDHYYPPASVKDTTNIVAKITRKGIKVIAVALDDNDEQKSYDDIKEIYPNIVSCSNLKNLTGQLLTIISNQLL